MAHERDKSALKANRLIYVRIGDADETGSRSIILQGFNGFRTIARPTEIEKRTVKARLLYHARPNKHPEEAVFTALTPFVDESGRKWFPFKVRVGSKTFDAVSRIPILAFLQKASR